MIQRKKFSKSDIGVMIAGAIILTLMLIAPSVMGGSTSYTVPFRFADEYETCLLIRMDAADTATTTDTIGSRTNDTLYDTTLSLNEGTLWRVVARYQWESGGEWYNDEEVFYAPLASLSGTIPNIADARRCVVGGWIRDGVSGEPLRNAVVTFSIDGDIELDFSADVNVLVGNMVSVCKTNDTGFFLDTLVRSSYLLGVDSSETSYNVSWKWGGQSFTRPTQYTCPDQSSDTLNWEN